MLFPFQELLLYRVFKLSITKLHHVNIRILILNLSPLHFFIETDFKIDKIKYIF